MKKRNIALLLMAMTLSLSACFVQAEEASTEAAAEVVEVVEVDTVILKEADDSMLNTYSVLAVNPEAPFVDADGNAV